MSEYSIALEEQLRLARFYASDRGAAALDLYLSGVNPDAANQARRTRDALPLNLASASPFYWTREMSELLRNLPDPPSNWRWTPADLITDIGFAWFAIEQPLPEGRNPSFRDSVTAMLWSHRRGLSPEDSDETTCSIYGFRMLADSMPFPAMIVAWPRDVTFEEMLDSLREEERDMQGDEIDLARMRQYLLTFAKLVSLQSHEIVSIDRERPPRGTRHRVGGTMAESVIRVVRLRRVRHHAAESSGKTVTWSCRWIVRAHWRQQWYPSRNRHEPKLIMPYPKGPDGAPLKQPTTPVFAVVR